MISSPFLLLRRTQRRNWRKNQKNCCWNDGRQFGCFSLEKVEDRDREDEDMMKTFQRLETAQISELTLKFLEPLEEAQPDVLLKFPQGGRLQDLEVDDDLVQVGAARGGFSSPDDLNHAAQLQAG